MKATRFVTSDFRCDGPTAQNSSFSVKHNDRNFDYENAEHINANAEKGNVYWDCVRGKNTSENGNMSPGKLAGLNETGICIIV